jgi:phosphatidylinositol kinase/protein kinase (PI-3  family)
MEVSGIEGNYRNTCENTMRVMRANKDSLLAILEAFVYDPLLSFRLLNLNALINQKKGEKEVFRAPDIQDKNVKNQSIKVDILDALK